MTDPVPWQDDPRISARPPGWVTTSGETWRDLDEDDARWLDRQWEDAGGGPQKLPPLEDLLLPMETIGDPAWMFWVALAVALVTSGGLGAWVLLAG